MREHVAVILRMGTACRALTITRDGADRKVFIRTTHPALRTVFLPACLLARLRFFHSGLRIHDSGYLRGGRSQTRIMGKIRAQNPREFRRFGKPPLLHHFTQEPLGEVL